VLNHTKRYARLVGYDPGASAIGHLRALYLFISRAWRLTVICFGDQNYIRGIKYLFLGTKSFVR
jgi:hypothetical protein